MEPQEQPTKAIFSFADELQRRQQRAEEQKAVWEQKQQRAAELYRSGQNPILAYIETMKPEADPARIKRAETAAKIAAWSNMLTALGTGIVGMATEGYVPKTGTDAPLRMLDRINEWEKLYDSQNREYRQLKLRALMGQQEGEQQAANMEASAAGQAYNLAQKQYDALLGYMWKAQQEKQKRAEDLRDKKEIEKIRGENNLKVARTRAAASASTASARGHYHVDDQGGARQAPHHQRQAPRPPRPRRQSRRPVSRPRRKDRRKPLAGTGKSALRERP